MGISKFHILGTNLCSYMMRLSEAVGWYLMLLKWWNEEAVLVQRVMLREQGEVYVDFNDRFVSLFVKVALPKLVIDKVPEYCSRKGYSFHCGKISG